MKKWKLKRTEKLIKNQNQESFWIEIPSLNYESKDETLDKRCQHFQVQARPTKLSWSELIYYLMRCPKSTYQACASIRIKWSATKIFGNFLLDSMPPQTMRSCLKLTVILVISQRITRCWGPWRSPPDLKSQDRHHPPIIYQKWSFGVNITRTRTIIRRWFVYLFFSYALKHISPSFLTFSQWRTDIIR